MYAPPVNEDPPLAQTTWDGKRLSFDVRARFPLVCLKCGTRSGVKRKERLFSYVPRILLLLAPLGIALGLAPYAILLVYLTRRAKPRLSLCGTCREDIEDAVETTGRVGLFGAVGVIAGIGFACSRAPVTGALIAVVTVALAVAWVRRFVAKRMLWASYIEGTRVTLRGIDEAAARIVIESTG